MHNSASTDHQTYLVRDEKESLVKFDVSHQAGDILKVFNRILNKLVGFILLTEEEQREAGVCFGHHRYD